MLLSNTDCFHGKSGCSMCYHGNHYFLKNMSGFATGRPDVLTLLKTVK